MLGGSFWVAFLRNAISTVLMLSFFLMLDRPRFSMKKTAWCYIIFGFSMIIEQIHFLEQKIHATQKLLAKLKPSKNKD